MSDPFSPLLRCHFRNNASGAFGITVCWIIPGDLAGVNILRNKDLREQVRLMGPLVLHGWHDGFIGVCDSGFAAAGGQLVSAAFSLLGELLPQSTDSKDYEQATKAIQQGLADCVETDEQGRAHLKLTLPDSSHLSSIADALARLTTGFE